MPQAAQAEIARARVLGLDPEQYGGDLVLGIGQDLATARRWQETAGGGENLRRPRKARPDLRPFFFVTNQTGAGPCVGSPRTTMENSLEGKFQPSLENPRKKMMCLAARPRKPCKGLIADYERNRGESGCGPLEHVPGTLPGFLNFDMLQLFDF